MMTWIRDRAIDLLEYLLNLSSEVRRREAVTVVMLLFNVCVLLIAYYVIKTVREPLIAGTGGSAELKSYASAFQAVLLLGYLPLYDWVSRRTSRMWLNIGVLVFFVGCIQLFFLAGWSGWPNIFGVMGSSGPWKWLAENISLGFVFYVWVGIFNVSVIAQFWSYANDLYDESTGKRLFPVIAIGATLGAPVGSFTAGQLAGIGPYITLQVSAALLVVPILLYPLIERRYCRRRADEEGSDDVYDEAAEDCCSENAGGFELILKNRYLTWVALFILLLNLVNTTGEYLLSSFIKDAAEAAVASGQAESVDAFIQYHWGNFYTVVNVVTVLIQTFIVSRVLKYFGMKAMIFTLPFIAFGTYSLLAAGVGLGVYRWAKTAENSTDYSLMNTTRALLWLPTTKSEQYAAKQTVDTFFVRAGDVLSALLVFAGTNWLAFGNTSFAGANLVLIVVWILVGAMVLRHFRQLSEERDISVDEMADEALD